MTKPAPANYTVESTEVGHLYYFAPAYRAPGTYLRQEHVTAIVDVAFDGTLAGVELIDGMPPPPIAKQPEMDEILQGLVSDLKEGCCVKPSLTGDGWHIDIPGTDVMCRMAAEALESAVRDRDHWKANHDQMVQRNAVLRERPDLPVDRLPAIARYEEQLAALMSERANIIATHREQLARMQKQLDQAADTSLGIATKYADAADRVVALSGSPA